MAAEHRAHDETHRAPAVIAALTKRLLRRVAHQVGKHAFHEVLSVFETTYGIMTNSGDNLGVKCYGILRTAIYHPVFIHHGQVPV